MNALTLTFAAPLAGYLILAFSRGRLSERAAAAVGVGSLALSALATALLAWRFAEPVSHTLWTWMRIGDFHPGLTLRLDGLSLTMLGVITGVGFLIHLFASWYMRGEEGYSRFFAYMNLFVASMVLLVLADNLVFLYLGWEGVGLCSYLLIGFYYRTVANGNAAIKAFIVTRIGDVFMALGMFILLAELGTLNIQELLARAPQHFTAGDPLVRLATLLLLGGAVGKSAQLPLQTWLAGLGADPRGDDGDRGRVPDRAHPRTVPARPRRAAAGRRGGRGNAADRRALRAGADRHQARARLLDDEPDRLHVPRAWRRRVVGGDLPPDDARLLQGTAVPRLRRGDHRLPS
jgi:hypothetical protein